MPHPRGVAQPGSALALGARCREFESLHPRPDFAARFRAGAAGRAAARRNRARSSNWIEHQPSKLGVVGSTPAGRAMVSSTLPAFGGRPEPFKRKEFCDDWPLYVADAHLA